MQGSNTSAAADKRQVSGYYRMMQLDCTDPTHEGSTAVNGLSHGVACDRRGLATTWVSRRPVRRGIRAFTEKQQR